MQRMPSQCDSALCECNMHLFVISRVIYTIYTRVSQGPDVIADENTRLETVVQKAQTRPHPQNVSRFPGGVTSSEWTFN